ncbi:MAG: glycerophosphodiester phosphodiesterase [Clostridia bacterium]|nr:glycerophosphodiester phosphodiesterase [Clostridia bacterium]
MWLFEKPIAHRGLHNKELTENSMGAFKNALDHGYNIETDVHLLKSGEVVVFHDDSLKRVCGKNVKIKDLTLDDIKGDNYLLPNGEHIPLFTEMLELVDGKTGILLELKLNGFNYDLEKAVLPLIKGKESWIAVQAFNPYSIIWFAKNAPEFYRGLLSLPILGCDVYMYAKRMKPHFISYEISGAKKMRAWTDKNGMNLLCWTIRDENKYAAALDNKINNIIFETIDLDKLEFSMDKLAKPYDNENKYND